MLLELWEQRKYDSVAQLILRNMTEERRER